MLNSVELTPAHSLYATSTEKAVRMRLLAGLTTLVALAIFVAGFLIGWDPDGVAILDYYHFHLVAIQDFHTLPWAEVLRDYPSATTPLYHMLQSLNPLLSHDTAFRASNTVGSLALCCLFVYALCKRFSDIPNIKSWAALIGSAVLISPYFESASYWPTTDNFPLWFLLLSFLIMRPIIDESATFESTRKGLLIICAVAVTSTAAFYTRQNFLFVSLFCFILIFRMYPRLRLHAVAAFGLAAMPAVYLAWLWNGLTPPMFHDRHQGMSSLTILGPLSMAAFYALPFLLELILQVGVREMFPSKKATSYFIGGGAIFILIFRHFSFAQNKIGGGVATKIFGNGHLGAMLFLVFAYCGLAFLFIVGRKADWKSKVLILCVAIPSLAVKLVFQRYYDPLLLMVLFLYFDRLIVRRFVNVRCAFILIGFTALLLFGCLQIHSSSNERKTLAACKTTFCQ